MSSSSSSSFIGLTTPPFSSSTGKGLSVTITPPSPIHLGVPRSTTTTTTKPNSPNNRLQALLKLFNYEYTNFVSFKHSIRASPSNAHPEESIMLELEQLKVWTSRVMAFISATLDKHQNPVTLDIIDKGDVSISNSIDHIESRMRAISPPSSPVLLGLKIRKQQQPKVVRLRDEKQTRDSLRRIVIRFYLRDYLGIEFQHTIPTTFTCASTFILNNTHLFASHISRYGKTEFPEHSSLWGTHDITTRAFIQNCQREILDIIMHLTFLLKRDANQFNYDNSQFHSVPLVLMDRIRIRLVKDSSPYQFDSVELTKASNTATRIFQSVLSSSSRNSSSNEHSDADTETEEDDDNMLMIDD